MQKHKERKLRRFVLPSNNNSGGIDQLIQRWASNRKVSKPGSIPDAVARRCVLGKDT